MERLLDGGYPVLERATVARHAFEKLLCSAEAGSFDDLFFVEDPSATLAK